MPKTETAMNRETPEFAKAIQATFNEHFISHRKFVCKLMLLHAMDSCIYSEF